MRNLVTCLFALLLFTGCNNQGSDELSANERFVAALLDASKELKADDLYEALVPLEYGVSPLVEWKIEEGDTLLLVATLQCRDWCYAEVGVGESVVTDASADNTIWVAIPGEMRAKLQSEEVMTDSLSLNTRLLEILGLRPDGTESVVNLLWIDKNSLLRPSYNPDIATTFGAIEYPSDEALPTWYKEWFDATIAFSYESPSEGLNYPFTRLGYTYDWGEGKNKYGLSEFITAPSSLITIEEHISCWEYYKAL